MTKQIHANRWPKITHLLANLDRLDHLALSAVALLIVATLITVLLGDRAGVGIVARSPENSAPSTASIRLAFAEPMDAASVESAFSLEPVTPGKFTWTASQVIFEPAAPLKGGQRYTVTLKAGARSQVGRPIVGDVQWSFQINPPRIVYLSPAARGQRAEPTNLWIVDPAAPFVTRQLTTSRTGVGLDYAISPDGTQIAYSEQTAGGGDLFLLDLATGQNRPITRCVDAICQAPSWSADGTRLVYERIEVNSRLPDTERGVARPWLLNLADLSTVPFLPGQQMVGERPRWSPNGNEIAVYDRSARGIVIYNVGTLSRKVIPSLDGDSGVFDPTGSRLVYPEVAESQQGFYSVLAIANLADPSKGTRPVREEGQPAYADAQAVWHPDGQRLTVARRPLSQQFGGAQLYQVDAQTLKAEPLINDPNYQHGGLSWHPSGDLLVVQRLLLGNEPQPAGLWVYSLSERALRQVTKEGILPQWLP